ncbi:MAG: 2-hydroxyhepta-2,4-diene-1,7-dioate isomerase [Gammaproteobacteria bacterium]|nr:2-hydroxyhepta-2,4-diene-1,7-dioate isomerase [Gammaproteobacteria bacterium]|tara:strand:- start:10971 stop:11606 length:636 start_codon:yes stop_codon:yes gene_type:complete
MAKISNKIKPSKILALWNNYKTLAKEKGLNKPENPLYINKSISTFIESGVDIEKPAFYSEDIYYEGEIGIVIGKECKNVEIENAKDYILGYTCVNDVTAMNLVKKDPTFDQWTRAKSFDTFGVFGPCVVSDIDPMNLRVTSKLNGKIVQDYNTSDMFFNVFEIVSYLSKDMTLFPGDIIACGTNSGLGPMNEGDTIQVSVEGIGELTNKLV